MQSSEIRSRFLAFFEKRQHAIIPSASLVTPDEKGITNATLFNTAGMQPLIPFLLGKPHPQGTRLADVQKCIRTVDIDEIGDKTHATFFEMLGNWSLGDYFKQEAISWSYQFLTDPKEGLGLDPKRLYVTVFEGDQNAVRDDESASIWQSVGVPKHRIYYKDASANWWPAVKAHKDDSWTGPTGPCTEMFYDITPEGLGDLTPEQFEQADSEQKVVEIWNDVFMEFEKVDGKIVAKLAKKNVDTGAGFERLAAVLQNVDNIYDTDLLKPLMDLMKNPSASVRSKRIVADHLKASAFLISDGVLPSNSDRGYILRRLIRRAIINTTDRKLDEARITLFMDTLGTVYTTAYPDLIQQIPRIKQVLLGEANKFSEALSHGMREFNKIAAAGSISGSDAFKLFSSFGLPIDVTKELAMEKGVSVDFEGYEQEFKKHQDLSRAGAEQKFKGGLADAHDPMVVRYHTATHLLHQALHDVLGEQEGHQKGSNITPERLRFDFAYGSKMTDEQKKRVEDIVNEKIAAALPMNNVVLPREDAEKTGARHFFGEKYGDQISIYFIGSDLATAYSKEFCGGPHVSNTRELAGPEGTWKFVIQKEEASSQGVRRIKAVLK